MKLENLPVVGSSESEYFFFNLLKFSWTTMSKGKGAKRFMGPM